MGVESGGRRIELKCPSCGHSQTEPSMVVSTICLGCRQHIDVRDGKSVVRPRHGTRLAAPGEKRATETSRIQENSDSRKNEAKGRGFLRRFFDPPIKTRSVDCYHCHHVFDAVIDAQSSQCPKCGGHISLRNYDIDQSWRRRIQTRGDVTIQKGASIIGVNVQCHDLTVLGQLAASVDCSGKIMIRSHGRILGNVKCDQLRVERGAEVEFQGEVHARSAYIDGRVKAQLTCTGTITLEKKAHLQGLARAGGLVVKAGAKHTGLMEVVQAKPEV